MSNIDTILNSGSTADVEMASAPPPDDGWEWAIVEIMGFRKHAGRCREVERFGAKLLRIDIPIMTRTRGISPGDGDGPPVAVVERWETHFYSGQSMFSYTPTDEATVLAINTPYQRPSSCRLPAPDETHDAADASPKTSVRQHRFRSAIC